MLGFVAAVPALLLGARYLGEPTAELVREVRERPSATSSSAFPTTTVDQLQPGLVDAFQRARSEASRAGHDLVITSGFRTAARQAELLEAEVAERGSLEEAMWWVFPPEKSMHVQGLAIDVGDGPAADWLRANGARFGLCKTLDWEWWHFEWRAEWEAAGSCPAPARTPDEAPDA